MENNRLINSQKLNMNKTEEAFIFYVGQLLGQAFQKINLQYCSEKMDFNPPFLTDFERFLQMIAFQQQINFTKECITSLTHLNANEIKVRMIEAWNRQLNLLSNLIDERLTDSHAALIVDELEFYFNSRYYAHYSKRA